MEPKLSISTVALGNLRRRRGRYLLLITGIVLAIYFVATALLFGATMFTSLKERHYHHNGRQDAIIFNCREAPLSELLSKGIFSEYGTAETLGYVLPDGQSMQNGFSIARFDESALKLAGKDLLSGRLPEKSGEIALEQSTLARLRLDAQVGDQVTLTLLIPDGTDFLEGLVQKNYTLVGILSDKLIYLHNRLGLERPAYRDPPAGLLAESEPIEAGGRPVVSCYGTLSGKAKDSYEQLEMFCNENELLNDWGMADLAPTRYQFPGDNFGNDSSDDIMITSILLIVITLVLVSAACLGIINAFAADLESRRRQIGLFRAVGATRKQIKQVFGREALLLSILSIPPALALACLTVWGISKVLGSGYTFRPSALIIFGLAAAGLLCVQLAASLPLGRASRIPPLQAIRNVDLFRRARRSRLQSQAAFDVPRLIALRQRLLYPHRQTGITVILALSIVLVSLAVFALTPVLKEIDYDYGCDFVLRTQGSWHDWLMEYNLNLPGITEQDKAEATALSGVKEVAGEKNLQVKILPEKITPYIIDSGYDRFDYLSPEQQGEYLNIYDDPSRNERLSIQYRNYQEFKAKYGYNSDFLSVDCCGADEILVKKLTPFVVSGQINLDKLNAGEEILIIAPEVYGFIYEEHDGSASWSYRYKLDPHTTYSSIGRNDMFAAGDRLALSLLYNNSPGGRPDGPQEYHADDSRKLPDDVIRIDKTVNIGAILTPEAGDKYLASSFSSYFYPQVGNIVTTTAGLQALGFDLPYSALAVTLSESPDQALEEYLEANLALIAARTTGTNLTSYLALTRENRRNFFGLLIATAAILILFFAICTSMINNALSARIRAGRREIGTLRAVGASSREIELSYRRQLLSMFAWGTIGGLVAELAFCGWLLKTQEGFADFVPIWQPLLFVALIFGIGYLNLRSKTGTIFRESIVENIREL